MREEAMRELTANEIEHVSGGTSPAEAAFVGTAGYIGGLIVGNAGRVSGSTFGGELGAALCSPLGPEASIACGIAGAIAGSRYGEIAGQGAGGAAGLAIGEEIWNAASSYFQNTSLDGSDSSSFSSDSVWAGGDFGGGGGGGGKSFDDNEYVEAC